MDVKKWKVLNSEYLHKESWLTLRKDAVELPNGKKIPDYYVLEYPNWVNVIAITDKGKFLFVRQYRHGLASVDFELCAGVCDKEDKSPMESAKRELMEETGYGNGSWIEYMEFSPNPGTHTNMVYCFLATEVERVAVQQLDETEDLTVHELSLDEVLELLKNDKIKQAVMAAPLWKYVASLLFVTRKK